MRRNRRPRFGRFLISVAFIAGFAIRDLMEDDSPVRTVVKDAWKKAVDFMTPAESNKKHFPDNHEKKDLKDSETPDNSEDNVTLDD